VPTAISGLRSDRSPGRVRAHPLQE
jgi:hypothetical protein